MGHGHIQLLTQVNNPKYGPTKHHILFLNGRKWYRLLGNGRIQGALEGAVNHLYAILGSHRKGQKREGKKRKCKFLHNIN